MTNDDHNWDEDERFAALFSSANHDASPPDAAFLARLRACSTEVFLDAFQSPEKPDASPRRGKMMVLAPRAWAAVAATLVLFASWFWLPPREENDETLGAVLRKLTSVESMHLKLVCLGQPSDVWVAQPTRLRWNRPDGTYQIDDGKQLWNINEQENQAVPQASRYFDTEQSRLDLLKLLDIKTRQDQAAVLAARPQGQVTDDGVLCDTYRWTASATENSVQVEAVVSAADQMLRSLRTHVVREGRPELVSQLVVASVNAPVNEELFRVGATLTVDGRIGKVTDCQGLVGVKPAAHSRWTPVERHLVLKPRDWIRTDLRGANAATLRLAKSVRVTLGPGTLVELEAPQRIKLVTGEVKVVADPDEPLALLGPDGAATNVQGTGVFRLDRDQVVALKSAPAWIAGFEGTSTQEAIGSLVAKIDGRDVPLTVGYHHVTVDIRDQIARTVIEESFVNHTPSQLEGVFYFPLPADASISGFGTWIGDQYVEADIVEKQRAREIYETILRERRDPGLLEWTGGNMFKARVFPILGNSEKRIRISYTQVLPRMGNRYRYSYALQSELLRQHPLRELGIDVKISSAVPLSAVTSPTHPTRIDVTQNSARVEFAAQEYTPSRDFEVVVELDGNQSDVVMIPHQRGEDGYFMLQVMPPTTVESPTRDVLPDGQSLKLLILADTSRSMDANSRTAQAEFVAALLSSLSPRDAFNLATCDVECGWVFDRPVPAEEGNVRSARKVLDERVSLGWTDLDRAFASALEQAGADAHVIYIGDGVVTTGNADAVEFTKRLQRLYEGRQAKMHAVAVNSRFESVVMKSIATVGDGSLHHITGEAGPATVARQLLAELTQSATRIVKVEFPGLMTARVYPEDFPRLPAGSQQILLGRYLPATDSAEREVIVTAQRAGETFQMRKQVSLKDADQGNSFIPRLWARMHLDALLQQGTSSAIQDEIIALSEEYHIITPYTSLLVLETDADRQRFQVKRRFQMRDGERFFATGRDQVNYELMRQQMRQAGDWRIRLRAVVLRELSTLGREMDFERYGFRAANRLAGRGEMFVNGNVHGDFRGGFEVQSPFEVGTVYRSAMPQLQAMVQPRPVGGVSDERLGKEESMFSLGDALVWFGSDTNGRLGGAVDSDSEFAAKSPLSDSGLARETLGTQAYPVANLFFEDAARYGAYDVGYAEASFSRKLQLGQEMSRLSGGGANYAACKRVYETTPPSKPRVLFTRSARRWAGEMSAPSWLSTLFPPIPPASVKQARDEPESTWPTQARAIAEALLRTSQLAAIREGLEITRDIDYFQPRRGGVTSHQSTSALVSPAQWLVRTTADAAQTVVHACDAQRREAYSLTFQLGRSRAATTQDLQQPPLDLSGYVLTSLEREYRVYVPVVDRQSDTVVVLTLTHPVNEESVLRFVIDAERHVVLLMETRMDGEVTSSQKYGEFVELSGAWWPTQIETLDAKGRRTALVTQRFQLLGSDACAARLKELQTGRDNVQFLGEPLSDMLGAKKSIDDGKGTFEDHLVMLEHFYAIQQWDRVMPHLESLEALAKDKPGMRWVRDAVVSDARRQEDLRQRIMQRAAELAQAPVGKAGPDQYYLAQYLLSQASNVFQANEVLALLDTLKPVFDAQPPHVSGGKQWRQYQIDYLSRSRQVEKVLELKKQQAVDYPRDASMQQQYVQALVEVKDYAAARAWLDDTLGADAQWDTGEDESLRNVITQMYREQDRYGDLAAYLAAWVATNPEGASAYQQYLSALIKNDQIEEATRLTGQWLEEGLQPGRSARPVAARLAAAVELVLGQGFELRTERLDPRWWEPLAKVVLFFAHENTLPDCLHQIMSDGRFNETEQCQGVRREILQLLSNNVSTLRIGRLQRFIDWMWNLEVEKSVWPAIADSLRKRWEAETHSERKHAVGQLLARVMQGKLGADEYLGFLRVQLDQGPPPFRASYASMLFEALLSGSWSAEREDEAFSLLPRLSDADDAFEILAAQVSALHRLTDSMVQLRFQSLMAQVTNQSELTRTELRDKQLEDLKQARTAYAERLKQRMRDASESMVPWMTAEWTYLQVILAADLNEVEQRCWEALGATPPTVDTGSAIGDALQETLLRRFSMTLTNLAARRDARPKLVERLLAYVDQGIGANNESTDGWKEHKYRLLIALDRSDELVAALRVWIKTNDTMASRWEQSLGYLLAEQGKLPEAIECCEKLRASDLLSATDLQALADWYMVLNERDKYEQARADEGQLRDALSAQLQRWNPADSPTQDALGNATVPGGIPGELEEDVLRIFAVLFAKSSEPANYVDLLRQYYLATRDFRLLTGLADAVVGQTAGKVYPWLQQAGAVLLEVREEATVDSLVARVPQVRQRAKSEVDQRALDLLELMLERRAAELLNQPGPHAERALTALQRAFKREWSAGEPRLMAGFLGNLGRMSDAALGQEQVRQLEALHGQAEAATTDRLEIALSLAGLYWSYDRITDATDLLQAALQEHQLARAGVLPAYANNALYTYVVYLQQRGLYVQGERTLLEQLKHPVNTQQAIWLDEKLVELYEGALAHDSEVSLGAGVALYKALVEKLQGELRRDDKNHRRACIERLMSVYRTARDKQIETAARDLVAFGRDLLSPVLKQQINEYQSIVGSVADNIKVVAGPREGLAFLIRTLNNEPRWFAYVRQDGWSEHAWRLSQLRLEVGELRDLEEPLLAIVTRELRRDLESRQERNRYMYWQYRNGYFWESQRDAFLRTAETVYAEYRGSPPTVKYVAEYVAVGLENYGRGIEMLLASIHDGTLDQDGQHKLVTWLHHDHRHGESIPLLQEMLERWPDNMGYRTLLMRAYYQTQRGAELLALLEQTDTRLHEGKHWDEGSIAQLSEACLDCGLYEQAVKYYGELIPLHKRTQPNRGIGGGTLSAYCSQLARAYAGLGETAEAVDAACEAVVSWGLRQQQRQEALKSLSQVLRQAKDLEQFVSALDREAEETGVDKPIVRKALGIVCAEKQEWAKAIVQLRIAIQLQPNDAETSTKLVECYDAQGDKQAAIDQLLASLESNPRDIEQCRKLGKRLGELGRAADVERADTSIIELLPNEAEGHAMLGEIRQAQDRWPEAAGHWEQVARIRRLEPTGLLKLAAAQIHMQQWDAAKQTIGQLKAQSWPARFDKVQAEISALDARVPK
jgi:hypothetical protein